MVEVACTGNVTHHCTGSCRHSSWKYNSLDDMKDLQREKVWMTCYLVSFHSPRKQQIFFFFLTCFLLLVLFCSFKLLLPWPGTIGVMVLQVGVMQPGCLRIRRRLSRVLQGPAEWWHWGAYLSARCRTGLQSQAQLLRKSCAEQCGLVLGWQNPAQSLCDVPCQLIQALICAVCNNTALCTAPLLW